MKEKIYALKQSAYYGALNGTLDAVLLGGVVLAFCLASVGSTHVGQPINWYALVIEGIALIAVIIYLVISQDLERAPFTESIPYYSIWILSWLLTAMVVFAALSLVATAMTAIALAQNWFTMRALIITGNVSGLTFIWCLFMHLCPEPAQ